MNRLLRCHHKSSRLWHGTACGGRRRPATHIGNRRSLACPRYGCNCGDPSAAHWAKDRIGRHKRCRNIVQPGLPCLGGLNARDMSSWWFCMSLLVRSGLGRLRPCIVLRIHRPVLTSCTVSEPWLYTWSRRSFLLALALLGCPRGPSPRCSAGPIVWRCCTKWFVLLVFSVSRRATVVGWFRLFAPMGLALAQRRSISIEIVLVVLMTATITNVTTPSANR